VRAVNSAGLLYRGSAILCRKLFIPIGHEMLSDGWKADTGKRMNGNLGCVTSFRFSFPFRSREEMTETRLCSPGIRKLNSR
jgi:hypothetical protein